VKKLRIVIAEDSEVIRDLLQCMLKAIVGFFVVGTAADGAEAVHLVSELSPDILILDINMPRKNGLEVLKEIRACDSSTVVVMYTADASPLARRSCLENGANFFLGKCQINELIEICNKVLLVG
jgi:DNA-binding NarL/FixJ family response regulator